LLVVSFYKNFRVKKSSVSGGGAGSQVPDEEDSKKGNGGEQVGEAAPDARGRVALVLLAEAHPPAAPALSHANVVHHEVVDVQVVGAAPTNFGLRCKNGLSLEVFGRRGVFAEWRGPRKQPSCLAHGQTEVTGRIDKFGKERSSLFCNKRYGPAYLGGV
jgi:hypothetical protein